MTVHMTLEQAFFLALFVIVGVVLLAELIEEIRWRLYLERRRKETIGTVKRGRKPW